MVPFAGETAEFYARYRRGFDLESVGFVADNLGIGADSVVVDVGCGGGQLTVPLASRARLVIGVDPEPQMLAHARSAAASAGVGETTSWLLGSAAELPALANLLGSGRVDALTLSNAAHFVDTHRLARDLRGLLGAGGTVGVIANGVPTWAQDSRWSAALRKFVMTHHDTDLSSARYTDEQTLQRCQRDLEAVGFTTRRERLARRTVVSAEWLLGNLFSAMSSDWIPAPSERARYAADFTAALRQAQPTGDFIEDTGISMLVAE